MQSFAMRQRMGRSDELGHSRPMHLVPVPINVRCYSNSNPIVRRSEVTLRAMNRHSAAFCRPP